MVDSEDSTGHALELAGSATLATARRRTALAEAKLYPGRAKRGLPTR
jgi:hypothetical protein